MRVEELGRRVQCGLKNSDVEDSFAQGDEPRDDVPQGRGYSVMTR